MSMSIGMINKTSYIENALNYFDPAFIDEAATCRFKKYRAHRTEWVVAVCLLISVAAATILLRPRKEHEQSALLPTPNVNYSTASISTTSPSAEAAVTTVPTPDISGMKIIYADPDDLPAIDDIMPAPGTCIFGGRIRALLNDERYSDCVFAVNICIEFLDNDILAKHEEESNALYRQMVGDNPAVVRYNELHDSFFESNIEHYREYLVELYFPDGKYTEAELEMTAEKYDEEMVLGTMFRRYLESSEQLYVIEDFEKAISDWRNAVSTLRQEQENRAEETALVQKRYNDELQRLADFGYIVEEYKRGDVKQALGLLTYDQLVNFPVNAEYAYTITLSGEVAGVDD